MGRRLNQYLRWLGDDGRPKVVFVFDDEAAPEGAEVVYRLNLRGEPVQEAPEQVTGEAATAEDHKG